MSARILLIFIFHLLTGPLLADGVIDAQKDKGFKLRSEVETNFGLAIEVLEAGKGPWTLAKEAIVYSKEEYQVFRRRDGFWMAVEVDLLRHPAGSSKAVRVSSEDLRAGDAIAVKGAGFLKVVELSLWGPAVHGHPH